MTWGVTPACVLGEGLTAAHSITGHKGPERD